MNHTPTRLELPEPERLRLVRYRDRSRIADVLAQRASELERAKIYIDKGWVSSDDRNAYGGETDRFDAMSQAFAVVSSTDPIEAVATLRLIQSDIGDLPVFEEFPELRPTHVDGIEVSRLIAKTRATGLAMRAVIIAELVRADAPGIAIVSNAHPRLLKRQGFVLEEIAGPTVIAQYGSRPQVAILIDAHATSTNPQLDEIVTAAFKRDYVRVLGLAHGGCRA